MSEKCSVAYKGPNLSDEGYCAYFEIIGARTPENAITVLKENFGLKSRDIEIIPPKHDCDKKAKIFGANVYNYTPRAGELNA